MTNRIIRGCGTAWRRLVRPAAIAAAAALGVGGCSGILDVDNPNNVGVEALDNPSIAHSLVNGAETSTVRALTAILAPYGTATDELTWVGSRDAYNQIDDGRTSDPGNEFVDAANFYLNESRWMADEAIIRLEQFETDKKLADSLELARAYLIGAVNYVTIADMFDDYTISDRLTPQAPIGEAQMFTLYDKAVDYLTKGLVFARAKADDDMEGALLAMRARASFSKAIWQKVNPVSAATTGNPGGLAQDAAAVQDATDALAIFGGTDYKLVYRPSTSMTQGFPIYGNEINNRTELRFGEVFVNPKPPDNRTVESTKIRDPIDNILDPVFETYKDTALASSDEVPLTIVSEREMYLIRAEAALAAGNTAGFDTNINALRALDNGLTPYTGAGISRFELLKHERKVNLFMQGRRWADLYRFGERADLWTDQSPAVLIKGCFFPITVSERQSNTLIPTGNPTCNPAG